MSGSENELGLASFEWARSHMPVFTLAEEYVRKKDSGRNLFRGLQLCACLHVSKETAVLIESFHSLGIQVKLVAANPLSSQNDIVAFLKGEGVSIDARSKESFEEYKRYIEDAARSEPNLIVDDGGELHVAYSKTNSSSCNGGTDETTSGVTRLRILDKEGRLRYPVVPVNDAETKHIFDNKYGSGQSAVDGLIRATGILLSGKCVVVAG